LSVFTQIFAIYFFDDEKHSRPSFRYDKEIKIYPICPHEITIDCFDDR